MILENVNYTKNKMSTVSGRMEFDENSKELVFYQYKQQNSHRVGVLEYIFLKIFYALKKDKEVLRLSVNDIKEFRNKSAAEQKEEATNFITKNLSQYSYLVLVGSDREYSFTTEANDGFDDVVDAIQSVQV